MTIIAQPSDATCLVQRGGRKDNAFHVEIVLVLDLNAKGNANAARFLPLLCILLALVLLALVAAIEGIFQLALVGRRLEFRDGVCILRLRSDESQKQRVQK